MNDDATVRTPSSSCNWRLGGRYLNRKSGQPLTLRYVGTLPPGCTDSAQWLGVEYDDPAHGKGHSGTFDGKQVFETSQAGAGAFIRLKKGDELASGQSLVGAIKERYGLLDDRGEMEIDSVELGGSGIMVEAPGLHQVRDRLRALDKLRQIGLEGQYIGSVGVDMAERAELKEMLKGVTLLDISRNFLESWTDVDEIMNLLPGLKTLIMNDSRIAPLFTSGPASLGRLSQLKELHLARSLARWDVLADLASYLTGVEELYLGQNPLDLMKSSPLRLDNLKLLSLEDCNLTSWIMLEDALRSLEKLEILNVSANPLSIDCSTDSSPVLASLRELIILSSPLVSVSSLATMSTRLPNLQILKHSIDPSLPLQPATGRTSLSGNVANDRASLVALFPTIIQLNGTEIRPKDRDEAERRFLSVWSDTPEGSGGPKTLYDILARKHGRSAVSVPEKAKSNTQSLRSKLISLHVYTQRSEAFSLSILPSASITLLRRKIAKKLDQFADDLSIFTSRRHQTDETTVTESSEVWVNEKVMKVEEGDVGYWFSDGDGVMVE